MRMLHLWRIVPTSLLLLVAGHTPRVAAAAVATGEWASKLHPVMAQLFATGMAPGMSVAAVKDGELVYAEGFGVADVDEGKPVNADTQFYIASTTKSFTAFAAALLAHRGGPRLDAPLSKLLPDARLHDSLAAGEITLRDLLTHTHGIANDGPVSYRYSYSGGATEAELRSLLREHAPAATGRAFRYGNIGYNVAGMVIDGADRRGWKEVLDREIFRPAGMSRTTAYASKADGANLAMPHHVTPTGFRRVPFVKIDETMHAAGGHLSTARDLARWVAVHLQQGRLDGRQLFPASVVAETHQLHTTQEGKSRDYARHGWGLGWDLATHEGDTLVSRFGSFYGSYHSHVSFMPARGVGVVVLLNDGGPGAALSTLVANLLYDALLERPGLEERAAAALQKGKDQIAFIRGRVQEDRDRRAARPQATAHSLASYAGAYRNRGYGRMVWALRGERLEVSMGPLRSGVEVYDGAKDQLRVELTGSGETIAFEFGSDPGRATALLYNGIRFERE
jgi:CubicO group peptidase (beta-lactamase class C family)